jgi:hypothetical protein
MTWLSLIRFWVDSVLMNQWIDSPATEGQPDKAIVLDATAQIEIGYSSD